MTRHTTVGYHRLVTTVAYVAIAAVGVSLALLVIQAT
jgi:hypothetical protein